MTSKVQYIDTDYASCFKRNHRRIMSRFNEESPVSPLTMSKKSVLFVESATLQTLDVKTGFKKLGYTRNDSSVVSIRAMPTFRYTEPVPRELQKIFNYLVPRESQKIEASQGRCTIGP